MGSGMVCEKLTHGTPVPNPTRSCELACPCLCWCPTHSCWPARLCALALICVHRLLFVCTASCSCAPPPVRVCIVFVPSSFAPGLVHMRQPLFELVGSHPWLCILTWSSCVLVRACSRSFGLPNRCTCNHNQYLKSYLPYICITYLCIISLKITIWLVSQLYNGNLHCVLMWDAGSGSQGEGESREQLCLFGCVTIWHMAFLAQKRGDCNL